MTKVVNLDTLESGSINDSLFEDTPQIDDSLFEDEPSVLETQEDKPGKVEAFARGALQDVTFGLSDEIVGAVEALGSLTSEEKLLDAYRRARDESRLANKEAEEAHGGMYLAGGLTGMAVPALLTGGASLAGKVGVKALGKTVAKEALEEGTKTALKQSLAKSAKTGAVMGGAYAAGQSEAELLEGDVGQFTGDVLKGAALGGTISAALPGALKKAKEGAKLAGKGAKELGKHAMSIATEIDKQTVDKIIKYADKIRNVLTFPEIQQKILKKVVDTKKYIDEIGDEAKNKVLSNKLTIDRDDVLGLIDDKIVMMENTANKGAIPVFKEIQEDFMNRTINKPFISERELLDMVQDTYNRGDFKEDISNLVTKEINILGTDLSQFLKGINHEYSSYANEMSKRYKNLADIKNKFGLYVQKNTKENRVDYTPKFTGIESELPGVSDKMKRAIGEIGSLDANGMPKTDAKNFLDTLEDFIEETTGRLKDDDRITDIIEFRKLKSVLEKGKENPNWAAKHGSNLIMKMVATGAFGASAATGNLPGMIGAAAALGATPLSRKLLQNADKIQQKVQPVIKTGTKALDIASKIEAKSPVSKEAYLAAGLISKGGKKIAISDNKTKERLDDYEELENLIAQFRESDKPAAQQYADQLEEYSDTYSESDKLKIRHRLSQQPAFRKLLEEYDKLRGK